jgi:hypothetical protein
VVKYLHNGIVKPLTSFWADASTGGGGTDAAQEKSLIGIDVADARHQSLVKQSIFDGALPMLESLS